MAKLQFEQCLGCGNVVSFTLETTGLYVAKCWWCGCTMTQVHGIITNGQRRRPPSTSGAASGTRLPPIGRAATGPPAAASAPPERHGAGGPTQPHRAAQQASRTPHDWAVGGVW